MLLRERKAHRIALGKTESIGAREKVKQKVSDALDRATFSEKDHAPRRS
jgi:hypothetical protein